MVRLLRLILAAVKESVSFDMNHDKLYRGVSSLAFKSILITSRFAFIQSRLLSLNQNTDVIILNTHAVKRSDHIFQFATYHNLIQNAESAKIISRKA